MKSGRLFSHFLLLFPNAVRALSELTEYGEAKHGPPLGWKGKYSSEDHYDALMRHLSSLGEEEYDESGYSHRVHVAWRAMAALEQWIIENEEEPTTS